MRLGEIDLNRKPEKAKFYLCKPNRQVIKSLNDIYDENVNVNLGKVNEAVFTVPSQIERNHQLIDNPLIVEIRHRYLIKVIYNNITEYFIHFEQNKSFSDSEESVTYTSYSTGYMLADKDIRGYLAESKNLTYIATDLLRETNWAVGYVDADFDIKFRQHEIGSQNVLQAIYELAEKFNALIVWDTVNLRINFYKPQNVGLNKGFRIKKYLESFDYTSNSEEMPTRLKLYGSEGLSIRRLSPTGMNYIEDFSYYVYPFERDSGGNVIQSSYYMSDGLCVALEDYNKILDGLKGQFDTFTSQLKDKQNELQKKEQELSVIETELKVLLEESDVLNSEGKAGTTEHSAILGRITTKENQMVSKQNEINTVSSSITALNNQISTLRTSASMETHLTKEQLLELNNFIITKEYSNESIIDDEDLLAEGIEVFMGMREPKVNLTMSLVNFLSVVEAQNDWNKLGLGDTITLESKRLKILITAKIIGISYDFENGSIDLTIANEKEIRDSDAKLLDMLYSANNTSTIVNMDKYKWDMIIEATDMVSQILNNKWDAVKNNIVAGYKQDITIGERGIVVKSPETPMNMLVIQNGMLALSNTGGKTYTHAITSEGILGETIIGKLLMGSRLIIEDESGIIRLSGSLQEIFDQNGNVKVAIGKYATGKYGMRIDSGSLEIVGGLTENQLNQSVKDKLAEANGVRADLRLTAPLPTNLLLNGEGITATVSGNSSKFTRLDYRGLYIQNGALDIRTGTASNRGVLFDGNGIRGYNSSGTKTFEIDSNGNATFGGYLNAATGTFSGSLSAASGSFSGSLNAATGTFSGNLSAASGTFYGSLQGATGSFSGALSGATGTFNGVYSGTITSDQVRGSTFVVGYGTSSTLTMTSINGSHSIHSSDSAGFRVSSNNSMGLSASGAYGVYVPNSVLDAQRGLRVSGGVADIQVPMTVQSTLNASTLQMQGSIVATQSWTNSNFASSSQLSNYATISYVSNLNLVSVPYLNSSLAQLERDIVAWANGKFALK